MRRESFGSQIAAVVVLLVALVCVWQGIDQTHAMENLADVSQQLLSFRDPVQKNRFYLEQRQQMPMPEQPALVQPIEQAPALGTSLVAVTIMKNGNEQNSA